MITSTTVMEDGTFRVRTVPGRIVLDVETGEFYNPCEDAEDSENA